ncbi:hypothetical protein B0H66DRAFT_268153 [Apodospora peruviana]|uniref:Uncharacterized protein n=1 Tax=Apodospora peruviana TaxID=516989 RepID=A0AAE0I6B1_9PEZI|nr:hypothetical protein B0H66DRAFT_268153 [Apodospora peruviana]
MATMTMTMTSTMSKRKAKTDKSVAQISELGDSIANTISSLQSFRSHDTVSATASRLADTLVSIQTSLEQIRAILNREVICIRLHGDLDLCTSSCRTLVNELGSILATSTSTHQVPTPTPRIQFGNVTVISAGNESDSDESIKGRGEPASKQLSFEIKRVERQEGGAAALERIQPFAQHILAGLGALVKACDFKSALDQESFLDSVQSREIFAQLKRDRFKFADLSWRDGSPSSRTLRFGLASLGSLLLPTGLLNGNPPRQQGSPPAKLQRRASLARATTWPILKQGSEARTAAREAREARKRSNVIDKQIEAEWETVHKKKCMIMTWGSHDNRMLLLEQFMALSSGYSDHLSDVIANPVTAIAAIRKTVLEEISLMVAAGCREEDPTAAVLTPEELKLAKGLRAKIEDIKNELSKPDRTMEVANILDEELVAGMETLHSSPRFRENCASCYFQHRSERYDMLIMDALRRVSAADYIPTIADYRRFTIDQRRKLIRGTFDFNGTMSLSWVDPSTLSCGSAQLPKERRGLQMFDHSTTSLVYFYDLATYDLRADDGAPAGSLLIDQELFVFETIPSSKYWGPHVSVILVFTNMRRFREKLRKTPMSKVFSADYRGRDGDLDQSVNYLVEKFTRRCKGRKWYTYVGEPDDPQTTGFILGAVKETKLNAALSDMGLFRSGGR